MIEAHFYDSLGGQHSSCNKFPDNIRDACNAMLDKKLAEGDRSFVGKTYDSVADKVCSVATSPSTQAIAAGGALIPSGYTQAASTGIAVANIACGYMPGGLPAIPGPPPVAPLATTPPQSDYQFPSGQTAPGSIAAFDPKRQGYRVAVPVSGLSGPAAFHEVGTQAAPPPGAQIVSLATFEKETGARKSWYKRPLVLVGIAAGLAAVGTGGYLLLR